MALDSARFLAVFALLVAPYAAFFYHYTGKVRFEGKNLLNYTIGQRILEGKSMDLAERELTPIRETGPDLDTGVCTAYSPYPDGRSRFSEVFFLNAQRNKNWLVQSIPTEPYSGSILLFLLAFFGLVGRPWDAVRFFREIYFGTLVAYILILLLAAHLEIRRYEFPLLPFILLWASVGIKYFMDWMRQTANELRIPQEMGSALATITAIGLLCWMFQLSYKTIPSMGEVQQRMGAE